MLDWLSIGKDKHRIVHMYFFFPSFGSFLHVSHPLLESKRCDVSLRSLSFCEPHQRPHRTMSCRYLMEKPVAHPMDSSPSNLGRFSESFRAFSGTVALKDLLATNDVNMLQMTVGNVPTELARRSSDVNARNSGAAGSQPHLTSTTQLPSSQTR